MPQRAELHFYAAIQAQRSGEPDAVVRSAAERALAEAPDWVAPRRLLDDLNRDAAFGLTAMREHLQAAAGAAEPAQSLYLSGRLAGLAGAQLYDSAIESDSRMAWGYHGRAWSFAREARWEPAVRAERRALALARSSWERSYFTTSLARFLTADERWAEAQSLLRRRLRDAEVPHVDRAGLEVRLVRAQLGLEATRAEAYQRGIELLRSGDLILSEAREVLGALAESAAEGAPADWRLQALAALDIGAETSRATTRSSGTGAVVRDALRPSLMEASGLDGRLARGVVAQSGSDQPSQRETRTQGFEREAFGEAIDSWLASLPKVVLDGEGMPREARLREVVEAARAADSQDAASLTVLGDALIRAGWFVEARAVAGALVSADVEQAMRLEREATAGRNLLSELEAMIANVDRGDPILSRTETSTGLRFDAVRVARVEDLLAQLEAPFERYFQQLGRDCPDLSGSPVLSFGPIGSLVHPGPTYSERDERDGIGSVGERVPGLADAVSQIGRFGIAGQAVGEPGPDFSLLPRIYSEYRTGEHMGVPWAGTVVWCEGTDIPIRYGRLGANIAGLAVHEGYWIDVAMLRPDSQRWMAVQGAHFGTPEDVKRSRAALEQEPIPLALSSVLGSLGQERTIPPLGESQRVRLAVLSDRQSDLGRDAEDNTAWVSLDELLEVIEIHEQGHVCDRGRFFPLLKNWRAVLGLLVRSGWTPRGVSEQLEYRAQLIALCDAPDPRLPLVSCLAAAEGASNGVTTHGAAYSMLLGDLVLTLRELLDEDPAGWPQLDPDAFLVHQLHRLSAESLRDVAIALAEREGLARVRAD